MSIPRGVAKFLSGVLLYLFLTLLVIAITMTQITVPSTMKTVFANTVDSQLALESNVETIQFVERECENKDTITLPFEGNAVGKITIDCTKHNGTNAYDLVKESIAKSTFSTLYEDNYECSFIQCYLDDGPQAVFSSAANTFFQELVRYALLGVLLFTFALLYFSENWIAALRRVGTSILFTGLPGLFLNRVKPTSLEEEGLTNVFQPVLLGLREEFLKIFGMGIVITIIALAIWLLAREGYIPKKLPGVARRVLKWMTIILTVAFVIMTALFISSQL